LDLQTFKAAIADNAKPSGLSPLLEALWADARGDWGEAHRIAQEIEDANGAWVHAYLHRKEGDPSNAGYWYARAGKEFCRVSLGEEWEQIAIAMLGVAVAR
jgi:hypothetical protein